MGSWNSTAKKRHDGKKRPGAAHMGPAAAWMSVNTTGIIGFEAGRRWHMMVPLD